MRTGLRSQMHNLLKAVSLKHVSDAAAIGHVHLEWFKFYLPFSRASRSFLRCGS